MEAETKIEYLKIAENFLLKRVKGEVTPKRITDTLLSCAEEYRPSYWRRLRKALEVHQLDNGFEKSAQRIANTKNPVTVKDSKLSVKPKQRRFRKVTQPDEDKIFNYFLDKGDKNSIDAIKIVKYLGVRPDEVKKLQIMDNQNILVTGSKKTENRGADRVLHINNGNLFKELTDSINSFKSSGVDIGNVQDRIYYANKKLFPKRKSKIGMYSWRHQTGSELKASSLSRAEIAYLMGHQSTKSVESYGNKRSGNGKLFISPGVDQSGLENIRENHYSPFFKSKPNQAKKFSKDGFELNLTM